MKFESGVMSADKVKGFIKITEFKGQSTTIGFGVLEEFVYFVKALKALGYQEIEIGLENGRPLLIFLDKEKTMAFGFAPRTRDGDTD